MAAGGSALISSDRLNSSLGGNDTFDFDCEEAVHVTPFRGGGKAPEAPPSPVAPPPPPPVNEDPGFSEDEPDTDDSLYVPDRKLRRTRDPPPRRARSKRRSAQTRGKENTGPKQNRTVPEHSGQLVDPKLCSCATFLKDSYHLILFSLTQETLKSVQRLQASL